MLWAVGVGRDEWQVNRCFRCSRELNLRLFGRFGQTLQRLAILSQVDAGVALEIGGKPVDDPLIEVVAAKVCIAGGRLYFKNSLADVEYRYVECSSAQIKHENRFVFLFIETIGKRSGCRFVDDSQNIQTGNLSRVLSGLPLCVIEVSRDCDHCVVYFFPKLLSRVIRKFPEHQRRYLLRRVKLAGDFETDGIVGSWNDLKRHILDFFLDL